MENDCLRESNFRIKVYTKRELACLYLPDTTPRCAMRTFIRWIRKNSTLRDALEVTGCHARTRTFTPRQVQLIVQAFDEP